MAAEAETEVFVIKKGFLMPNEAQEGFTRGSSVPATYDECLMTGGSDLGYRISNGLGLFMSDIYPGGTYKFGDGTVTAPSITFANDDNTGRYRIGNGNPGESSDGTLIYDWNGTRIQTTVPVYHPNGTSAAPTVTFTNSTGTGLFYASTGLTGLGFAVSGAFGAEVARFTVGKFLFGTSTAVAYGGGTERMIIANEDGDTGCRLLIYHQQSTGGANLQLAVSGTSRGINIGTAPTDRRCSIVVDDDAIDDNVFTLATRGTDDITFYTGIGAGAGTFNSTTEVMRLESSNRSVLIGATTLVATEKFRLGGGYMHITYGSATALQVSATDGTTHTFTVDTDGRLITSTNPGGTAQVRLKRDGSNLVDINLDTLGIYYQATFSGAGDKQFSFRGSDSTGLANTIVQSGTGTAFFLALSQDAGGDAFINFRTQGVTDWVFGLDNSVSGDPCVLAPSTALGTSNVWSITTGGLSTWSVSNTSTTPIHDLVQSSTGDAGLRFAIGSTASYIWAIDNDASDALVLAYAASGSAVAGTNNRITIATTGATTIAQWLNVGTATEAIAQGQGAFSSSVQIGTGFTAAVSTTGAELTLSSATPNLILDETDQAANSQMWEIMSSGGVLRFRVVNDAYTATTEWCTVTRSTSNTTGIFFNNSGVDCNTTFAGDSLALLLYLNGDASLENIALLATTEPNWQTMDRGLFVGDTTTAPTGNPTAGGFMYSNAGAGTWRGSSGTVTAFGPAGPHCGECGADFWTVAAKNENWGAYIYECGWCGKRYKKGPTSFLAKLDAQQRSELIYS